MVRAMQEFPAHPRLAHMLLKARERGAAPLAAELAALLSDRDLLRAGGGPRERDSDVRTRLEALRRGVGADRGALDRVRRAQRSFEQQLGSGRGAHVGGAEVDAGVLLGLAYPDRIGRRRAGPEARYQLSNGRGALFAGAESIAREEFIVAVDLDDREREAQIRLAAPLDKAALLEHFAAQLRRADELVWDSRTEAVVARRVIRLDELLIEEKPLNDVPRAASAAAMLEGIRSLGLDTLPWDDDARDFLARCEFVRKLGRNDLGDWPDVSKNRWHRISRGSNRFLDGATRRSQLSRVPIDGCITGEAQLRTAAQAGRTRADARPPSDRLERTDRLSRRQRANCIDAYARGIRPGSYTADWWRQGASDLHVVVTGTKAVADHPRSCELLAQCLRRGAQGHARQISAPLLAGESAGSRAHAASEAARDVASARTRGRDIARRRKRAVCRRVAP
jgi:HrpA-like RNA helicase